MEAGPNTKLLQDFYKNATIYSLGSPTLSYDETIANIHFGGELEHGGIANNQTKKSLLVEIQCLKPEDLYFNLIITLPGGKSIAPVF